VVGLGERHLRILSCFWQDILLYDYVILNPCAAGACPKQRFVLVSYSIPIQFRKPPQHYRHIGTTLGFAQTIDTSTMRSISRLMLRHLLRPLGPIGPTALQSPVCVRTCTAFFSSSSLFQSGHNRWSKIRHDKGTNDANKSAEFSRLSQEICSAVKSTITCTLITLLPALYAYTKLSIRWRSKSR